MFLICIAMQIPSNVDSGQKVNAGKKDGQGGYVALFTRISRILSVWIVTLSVVGAVAYGQSAGAIVGTVTDPSGALIPGVEVTATDQGTNLKRTVVTNETGNYRIEPLQIG